MRLIYQKIASLSSKRLTFKGLDDSRPVSKEPAWRL
jgi:hypothetical protein